MTTAEIRQRAEAVLAPLLPAGPGVAVAARCGEHEVVLTAGTTALAGGDPVGPGTRFEIGSLTKTFTALLLADSAARGEVCCDDPLGRHLPQAAHLPGITLRHLATHSSGLPRLPPGLLRSALPSLLTNPYRAFTPHDLLNAVRRTLPRRPPGSAVRYSNFGIALLGAALAAAANRPFEDLLADRVLRPLGLTATGPASAPQVTGHWHGLPRPPWQIPGLAAAGVLRSTARDLLRYLTAHLDPDRAPMPALSQALADVARPRIAVPGTDDRLCLVWNHRARPGHDLVFHSGGTRGCTAFAGFSPQARTAVVTLVNAGPTLRSRFVQHSYLALRTLAAEQVGHATGD